MKRTTNQRGPSPMLAGLAWKEHLGSQFDSEFIDYLNRLVQEHERIG